MNVANMQRHATNQAKSIGMSETFLFSAIVLNLKSSMCGRPNTSIERLAPHVNFESLVPI